MIEQKLTVKQQAFADFYIELGNVEGAALKAALGLLLKVGFVENCSNLLPLCL